MVTGASTADCAVILLDARKGVLRQTRRHSHLVALLGIRHVALAINKMDLVEHSEARYREIEAAYREFAAEIGLPDVTCIPVSALAGDNVVEPSERMPWYDGPTLLRYLEEVEVDLDRMEAAPFRMPVQWVSRPSSDFRGFAGTIAGGTVRPGDEIRVLPRDTRSTDRADRHLRRRPRRRRRRPGGDAHARRRDRRQPRRHDRGRRRAAGRRRPVRGDGGVDGRRPDVPRAATT